MRHIVFSILMLVFVMCCACKKNPIEEGGNSSISIEYTDDDLTTALEDILLVRANVHSAVDLQSVSYYLMIDSTSSKQIGSSITNFPNTKNYNVSYNFRVTEMFVGFKIVAVDVQGYEISKILPVKVLQPDLAIIFPESKNDTVYVNALKPEVLLRVISSSNLSKVAINRLHSNGAMAEFINVSNFSDPHLFEHTITSGDGVNFSDATLVKFRVIAENEVKNSIVTVNLSMYLAPVINFTIQDTLKVNIAEGVAKPSPTYTINSGGLSSITTYLLYRNGTSQQLGNVISDPSGVLYNGTVTNVPYSEDLVGIKIVAIDNAGNSDEATLPVYCYLDLNIPPVVSFIQPQTAAIYGSVNPMIRFRVKSPAGLSKLTFYRVLTNEDEMKLGEVTSFSNSKDYVGEIPGLEKSNYGSLAGVYVLAEDVGGRWSKQSLNIPRSSAMQDEQIAFPGADGYGKAITGGRGGQIIEVTTLADNSSKGSLRWAINQFGPRIIVFKVSGTIRLTSRLNISNGDVTIAGQTAPGDGITLRDYPVRVSADNVILRYLRFRMGDVTNQEDDALQGQNRNGVMIDHCSLSWSTDECGSFYDNQNFTLQWSILSESLRVSVHGKGSHGYGGIWGGKKASFHHNLLAHHDSRNPRFCGSRYSKQPDLEIIDFRNNVIYNWGGNSAYAGEGGKYNLLNNYYRPGAATKSGVVNRIFSPNAQDPNEPTQQPAGTWGQFWLGGNTMHDNANVTNDNWLGFQPNTNNGGYPSDNINNIKLSGPFAVPEQSVTHSADNAYLKVANYAGASLVRDTVDKRVTKEAYTGTYTYMGSKGGTRGIIDTQEDVGGWPELESLTPPADSDGDGMPDAWEIANGLNPSVNDANAYDLSTNYTNIEVYMNSLVEHITKEQLTDGI